MKKEGVDKLFFELASESRLAILHELQKHDLRMQEVARQLDLTTTETFRQLQRLSDALLVKKNPDGAYEITSYGKLALHLSPSLEFVFDHREYFSNHDVWKLPHEFVDRIGNLSKAKLIMDTMEAMNEGQRIFLEAEEYAWSLTEHPSGPIQMANQMTEKTTKGLKVRSIIPGSEKGRSVTQELAKNLEIKYLAEVPLLIAVTEKEAAVCFRFADGRMDYAGFVGRDPIMHSWAKDFFLYYWSKAR